MKDEFIKKIYSDLMTESRKRINEVKHMLTEDQYNDFIREIEAIERETLKDNPEDKDTVNHIDEVKTNNHVSNLEWMTNLENIRYGTGIQRRIKNQDFFASNKKSGIARMRKVRQVKDGETIARYDSIKETKLSGYDPICVCRCCKNERLTHKGFKWEYV